MPDQKIESLWNKCPGCDRIIYQKELDENLKICPKCHYYLRMNARERIELLADKDAKGKLIFDEIDADLSSNDPLQFYDGIELGSHHSTVGKPKMSYLAKVVSEQKKTQNLEGAVCGQTTINGQVACLAVMDFDFMAGSMGSVVGEKLTRAMELSLDRKVPLIIVSASGGARMQEGILSLMQMAKTSAALALLQEAGVPVISVLCDPTTGGVSASFAMLGDVHVAEPKALIAFAGPRVIEQTIRQKLPEGFQQAEFLLKHGMVDCIVERKDMKDHLTQLLKFFGPVK